MTDSQQEWMMAHALAKPTKATRKRANFDTTGMPFAKVHPLRDPEYRQYVRDDGPCWLTNLDVQCGTKPGRGPTECAHLPYSGVRGMGEKVSDAASACLCPVHHDILDSHVLPYQVIALLWMKALFLREKWHRLKKER